MILIFIEHSNGKLNRQSLEAIAAGQSLGKSLGMPVSAVALAEGEVKFEPDPAGFELEKFYVAKGQYLARYTPDAFTDALCGVISALSPKYVIFAHTYQVRDFSPKAAARCGREVVADCIRYRLNGQTPIFTRRIFLGKLDADVVPAAADPVFVTFQSGAFRPDAALPGTATVETLNVSVNEPRMIPEEPFQEAKASVDLSKSERIVAIGRGIKSQENIALAQSLADALGADLAASRPICDNEWLPIDRQIGSSGQTVAPKLYLALGISGAIQHIVGMKNSQTIVAINKDPEAPIFDIADYGIVGDLFEAVPAILEELKKG
ncbi:MAG TPA: electron transfer flavoprotein subunit alpha/FixB family protein [Pyrinomonadaceae bacterium]|nr:electron transfer flavoprotein subunit alpha/FixB family protein [Pyrinomonadaceae bacterium]